MTARWATLMRMRSFGGLVALVCGVIVLAGCQTDSQNPAPNSEVSQLQADVAELAVALESALRGGLYPLTLAEAETALAEAGLEPAMGHTVAGYRYDAETVEFLLCLENAEGAFAAYNTAPMSVAESGVDGGCAAATEGSESAS